MELKDKYDYNDLLMVVEELRSEHGCPWDRKQTHDSLKYHAVEEVYELQAAIRIFLETQDDTNLVEELGDLLFQVVLHAQIGKADGRFSMDEVIDGITRKMIRRHPHVFGGENKAVGDSEMSRWDQLKKEEKAKQSWVQGPLSEVPRELPALIRAPKVLKKLRNEYQVFETEEKTIENIKDITSKMENWSEQDKKDQKEQLSELLLQISNLAMQNDLNLEEILALRADGIVEKYEKTLTN